MLITNFRKMHAESMILSEFGYFQDIEYQSEELIEEMTIYEQKIS
jgi:hypothetical protein